MSADNTSADSSQEESSGAAGDVSLVHAGYSLSSILESHLGDNNPFHDISPEQMSQIAAVLSSDEGKRLLQQQLLAQGKDEEEDDEDDDDDGPDIASPVAEPMAAPLDPMLVVDTSEVSMIDLNTSANPVFDIDDVDISAGLRDPLAVSDLVATFVSGGDAPAASTPNYVSSDDDDTTVATPTPGAGGEDSQQGMTGAEDEEDEEDTGRKRGGGSGGPKRRSSRIQDLEQREQAEKIRQENLQREREALQALKKAQDGPGEDDSKEEQVDSQDEVGKKEGGKKEAKSYNMRTKRPQRNDGRVDYTRGRGRGRGKGRGRGSSATRVDEVKIEDDSCKGSPSVSGQDDQEMETDEKVERMEAEEEEKKETPPQRGGRRSRGRSGDLLTPPRRGGGRRGRGAATTPTSSTTTPSSSSQQLDDSMDVDTDSDTINLISDQSDIPSPMISPRKSGRPMARRGRPFARRGGPLARGRGGGRKTLPPSDSHVVEDDSDTETDTAGGSAEPKEDDSKTVEGNVEKTTPPARGKGRGASRGARGNKRGARSAPAVSESPLTIASDSEDPLAVKEDKRGSGNDLEREKESSELNTPDSTLATNKPSRQIKEVKMYGDWEESNKKSPKGKNKKSDASTDSILNTTLESEDEVPLSALQIAAKEDTTGKLEECTKNKDESHIEDEKKQVEKSKSPRRRKTKGGKSKGKLKEDGENEDKESGESSNETEETEGSGSEWGSEDDPERLWCICQKPYNNRFMLCCDKCDNWFHGSCVGVTKRQGKQIEKDKLDWNCPDCLKDEKKPMKSKKSPSASKADSPESTTAADTKTEEVTEKEKPKEEKNDDTENPLEKVKERARANTDGNKGESEELISEKILKGAEESKEKVQVLQEKVKKLKEQRGQKADGDDKDGDNVEAEKAAKKAAKEDKKKKEKEKELQERRKKREALPVNERCLAKDCPNRRKEGVYCSEKCVEIHAEQSLKLLANQRKKIYGNKPLSTTERVVVMDRKSGKLLTGPAAPTEATLKLWLKKHMTFEVLQPGSDIMGATSSLGRIPKRESKESQELKERRDTREKLKEKIAREKREAQRRLEEQEKLRQREEKERHQKEEPRSNDSYRPRDDHGYGHRREDSVPVPDNFRITCRRALHEALTFRADGADDVMMSSAEIKRLALEIEEEMFRFYNGVNLKYKNKHRNIVANLRDPKNKGLYRKVLNAKISPGRLVRFTTDQLASEELARWKEKEPPQVPVSISQEIKEKPKVSLPASVDDDPYSGYAAQHIRPAYDYASDLLSSIIVDTTANHQNHLFDVNCKICNGKMDSKNDDTPKKTPGSDGGETPKYYQGQPADSYQQQHFAGFYVQAEPNSPLSPPLKPGNNAAEQQASEKKVQDTAAVQKPPSANLVARDPRAKHNQSKPREAAAVAAPAAAASKPPAVVSQPPAASHPPQPPPPAAASAKPAAPAVAGLPPNAKHMEAGRHSLWKGQLHVPDMCMFYAKAYRISGPWEEIHKEMPQTLALVGRLSPGQVWDYLNRMKNSTTRAVCVLRFDVIRPQDAKIYADLFTYLSTRDRCGVVNSFSKGVKDMYVVPLPAEKPIPEVLLPFSGPGIPVGRTNLLLAVIVKLLAKSKKPVDKPVATPAPPVMPAALKEFPSGLPPTVSAIPSLAPLVPTANVQKPTVRIDPRLKGHEKPTAAASESLASPADLTIDADEDDDDDLPLDTSDPIVQQFARAKKSKLEVPKIQPIEPAKDAEDDLPYEPEGAEELGSTDMYDPFAPSENSQSSLGLEPPKSTAGNIQSNGTETKTSQPAQIKADSKSAPGVNLNTLISTMGATSSNPAEMTARMLATLAATGTGGIDQQRALLMALTKQVEEQKRELERRQEEQKKEIEQKQKTVTETAKVSTSAAVSEEVPPPPPPPPQSTAGAVASTAPVIDVPDIPLPPTTQHAKTLDAKSEAKSEPKPESKTDARKEEDGEPANENNEKEKVDVPVEEMKPDVKPKSFYKPIEEEPLACNLARSRLAKKIQKETKAEEMKKKEESKAGVAALPAALQALLSGQSFENLKNIVASVSTLPKPAGSSSPMQNEQTNKSSSNIQADEEDELEKAMNNPGGLKTILKEKQDIEKKVKEELNDSLEGWQIEQAEEEERKKHRLREEEIKKAERKKKWEEKLRSNPNISLSLGAQNAEEDFDVINPHGDVDYRVHGGKISSAFDDSPPHCSQPPNWQTSMSVPSSQFVDKSGAHTTPGTAIFPDIPTTSSVQHPLLPSLQKKNEDRSNISIPGLGEAPGLTNASPISFAGLIPNTLSVPTSLPATHTMATSQAGASNTAEPKSKLQKMTAEELAALAAKQLEDESESQAAPASEDMDISKEDEQMEKETNDEKTRSSDKKHRKKRSRSEEKRDAFRSKKSRRSRSRSPGKHRKDKKKRNNDDRRKGKHYKLSKSPSPDLIDNADSQISESTSHRRSRSKSRDRDRRRRRRSRSRERRRSRSRDRDRRRSRSRERRRSRSRDRGRKRFYDHSNSRSDHRRYIPPPLDPVDPDEGVSYDPSQPFEPMSKPKSASGDKNSVPEVPLEPEENFDEEDDGELDIPLPKRKPPPKPLPVKFDSLGLPLSFHSGPKRGTVKSTSTYVAKGAEAKVEYIDEILQEDENKDSDNTERKSLLGNTVIKVIETRQVKQSEKPPVKKEDILTQSSSKEVDDEEEEGELDDEQDGNQCGTFAMGAFLALMSGHKPEPEDEDVPNNAPPPEDLEEGEIIEGPKKKKKKLPLPIFPEEPEEERKIIIVRKSIAKSQESGQPGITTQTSTTVQTKPEPDMAKSNKNKDGFSNTFEESKVTSDKNSKQSTKGISFKLLSPKIKSDSSKSLLPGKQAPIAPLKTETSEASEEVKESKQEQSTEPPSEVGVSEEKISKPQKYLPVDKSLPQIYTVHPETGKMVITYGPPPWISGDTNVDYSNFYFEEVPETVAYESPEKTDKDIREERRERIRKRDEKGEPSVASIMKAIADIRKNVQSAAETGQAAPAIPGLDAKWPSTSSNTAEEESKSGLYTAAASTAQQAETFWGSAGEGSQGVGVVQPRFEGGAAAAAYGPPSKYDPHTSKDRDGLRGGHAAPQGGLPPHTHGHDWRQDSDMSLFGQKDVDARVDLPRMQGLIAGTIREEIRAFRSRDVDLRAPPLGHLDGDERRGDRLQPPRGLFGEEGDGDQALPFGQTDQDYRMPPRDRDYRELGQTHMDRDYRGSAPGHSDLRRGDRSYPRDNDSRINDQDYRNVPPMYSERRGGGGAMPRGGARGGGYRGGRPSYGPPRGAGHRGGRGGLGHRSRGAPPRGGPPRGRDKW